MKSSLKTMLCTLLAAALSACASMSGAGPGRNAVNAKSAVVQDMASISEVRALTDGLQTRYGANNVLVVFDIDDTLLTGFVDLGSTAWWNWQGTLAKTDPAYLPFGKRLAVANTAFALSNLHPVEGQATVDYVQELIRAGTPVYALTARGPDNRDATLRELHRNGLDMKTAPECGPPLCVKRGILDGDKIVVPLGRKRFGFGPDEKTHDLGHGPIKLSSHRPVSVSDGVMMVSGQNKGVMLRLLIDSLPKDQRPKAVVFVDDSAHNIRNAKAASPAFGEALYIIHYTAKTPDQKDYMQNRKREQKAAKALDELSHTVCHVFATHSPICQ